MHQQTRHLLMPSVGISAAKKREFTVACSTEVFGARCPVSGVVGAKFKRGKFVGVTLVPDARPQSLSHASPA